MQRNSTIGVPALFHRRSREPWLVTMRSMIGLPSMTARNPQKPTKERGDTHDTEKRKSPASPPCEPHTGKRRQRPLELEKAPCGST